LEQGDAIGSPLGHTVNTSLFLAIGFIMFPSQVSEIKQQAIIEKAQDPNSSVSPDAAKEVIVDEAKKAGSAAYQLNPNATTAQRQAQLDSVSRIFYV
jgi:hypothetical protein